MDREQLSKRKKSLTDVADTEQLKSIMKLCQSGRVDLKAIIDETYLPEICQEVYTRLITDLCFPVVLQFYWRNVR